MICLLSALLIAGCGFNAASREAAPGQTPSAPHAPTPVPAEVQPYVAGQSLRFRRLSLDDGLSQSSINCMVQDGQGFMWFGTEDGLNRYDGYTFRVYRNRPGDMTSLSSSYIVRCARDRADGLWFVTNDGVLHRYLPEIDGFVRYELPLTDPFGGQGAAIGRLYGDSQGRLWIPTQGDGLMRYDPETDAITTYGHAPEEATSLSHRVVYRILEDHEGTIWVGTEAGLNRYVPETSGFVRYPYRDFPPGGYQVDPPMHAYDAAFQPDNPQALASPAAVQLLEDGAGRLWVGTRYGGLNLLDRASGRFTPYPFDPSFDPSDANTFSGNSVLRMIEDREGGIWVASAHQNLDETRTWSRLGLERLDPDSGTIRRYAADAHDPCAISHDAVFGMHQDARGVLWFHTFAGGVDVYDSSAQCFTHYGHLPEDPHSLGGDDVSGFYTDAGGSLWIGTMVGGVSLYDPTWAKFTSYTVLAADSERLDNNSVWRIVPSPRSIDDDGKPQALWLSTFAGVNYWDRTKEAFTYYEIDPALPDTIAHDIYEDSRRHVLWLGTTMGLEKADLPADTASAPRQLTIRRVMTRTSTSEGLVVDMHPVDADELWLARYRVGLSRFDLEAEAVVATHSPRPGDSNSLSDARIRTMAPGRDGTLWLATAAGVDHFDPRTATFVQYRHDPEDPESVPDRVYAIYQDEQGWVWLGSPGGGLSRFDPDTGRVVATYRTEQGLPNNVIYSILPDDEGHLWLSTNLGLARFSPDTERIESYSSQDGLQSNEFNLHAAYRAPDGELLFGGVNGLSAFYPESIVANAYVPPIVITGITIGPPKLPTGNVTAGGSVPPLAAEDGRVELSYKDRILTIEYAALHYAIPERNLYAYRMEGFDTDWHYVGHRRLATYTNLPPGRYTFRVKGTNSDGVWNEAGATLSVNVLPPFWGTWWFRTLLVVAIAGAVAVGYRARVRAVEVRSQQLEREVAERTRELAAVNAIAAVVSGSLDLEEVLTDALAKTLEVVDIEAGGIYLLDDAGRLGIAVQQGFSPELVTEIDNLKLGEGFSGRVAQSGEPLVIADLTDDPRLTRLAVQQEGLRSLAVVPVQSKGRVLGTLYVITKGYRPFTQQDVQLLTAIGHQIGVAIENARLFADGQRRAEQFQLINEVGRRTTSILSTNELLDQIVRLVQESFDYTVVEVGLIEGEDLVFRAGVDRTSGSPFPGFRVRVGSEGVTGLVAATGEPRLVRDVSQEPRFLRFTDSHSGSELAVPIRSKGTVIGVLNVQSERSDAFDESDLSVMQALADQAGIAIENARLFESEQRRAEQFRVIGEVGSRITSILPVDQLLEQVATIVQKAFGYYHVGIGLVEGDAIVYRVGAGELTAEPGFAFEPARLRVGSEGITGWVAGKGEPLLVRDVREEPRYVWMRHSRTKSELTLPLKTKGAVIGVLDVQSDELDAFDDSDVLVLQSLANQAAIAIDNARLYEQARRLAVVEERQRLARELHDSVTQALYGVTLYAEASARQLSAGHTSLATEHLHELRDTAHEALREMRLLIFELRPSILESEGLVNALRARLEAVEERAGLAVALCVDGEALLPSDIEQGLYRIAQEALNNALKHARANNVSVALDLGGEAVVLEVEDDGVGFDTAAAVASGGLGIDGMTERAAAMGGTLALESRPGIGTTIRVEVPR